MYLLYFFEGLKKIYRSVYYYDTPMSCVFYTDRSPVYDISKNVYIFDRVATSHSVRIFRLKFDTPSISTRSFSPYDVHLADQLDAYCHILRVVNSKDRMMTSPISSSHDA